MNLILYPDDLKSAIADFKNSSDFLNDSLKILNTMDIFPEMLLFLSKPINKINEISRNFVIKSSEYSEKLQDNVSNYLGVEASIADSYKSTGRGIFIHNIKNTINPDSSVNSYKIDNLLSDPSGIDKEATALGVVEVNLNILETNNSRLQNYTKSLNTFYDQVLTAKNKALNAWQNKSSKNFESTLSEFTKNVFKHTEELEDFSNELKNSFYSLEAYKRKIEGIFHNINGCYPERVEFNFETLSYTFRNFEDENLNSEIANTLDDYILDLKTALDSFNNEKSKLFQKCKGYFSENNNENKLKKASKTFKIKPLPKNAEFDIKTVRKWWLSLTEEEKETIIQGAPEMIGDLWGVPVDARDKANRVRLLNAKYVLEDMKSQAKLDVKKSSGSSGGYYDRNSINAKLYKVRMIENKLDDIDGLENALNENLVDYSNNKNRGVPKDPQAKLLSFDDDRKLCNLDNMSKSEPLHAVVALGDIENTDNLSVKVGGVGTTPSSSDMVQEQRNLLKIENQILDKEFGKNGHEAAAGIAWYGYDAPEDPFSSDAINNDKAIQGGKDLTSFLEKADEFNGNPNLNTAVTGHSYGSRVVAYAAQETSNGVIDNLEFDGSPGVSNEKPFNVPEGHVYSQMASNDPIRVDAARIGSNHFAPTDLGATALETNEVSGTPLDKYRDLQGAGEQGNFGAHSIYSRLDSDENLDFEERVRTSQYNSAAVASGFADTYAVEEGSKWRK